MHHLHVNFGCACRLLQQNDRESEEITMASAHAISFNDNKIIMINHFYCVHMQMSVIHTFYRCSLRHSVLHLNRP